MLELSDPFTKLNHVVLSIMLKSSTVKKQKCQTLSIIVLFFGLFAASIFVLEPTAPHLNSLNHPITTTMAFSLLPLRDSFGDGYAILTQADNHNYDSNINEDEDSKYDFNIWLVCTISIKQSYLLLPYFIDYYLSIGIKPNHFLINIHLNTLTNYNCGDNNCDESSDVDDKLRTKIALNYLIDIKKITKIILYAEGEFAGRKLYAENRIVTKYIKSNNDYILTVDSDEFQDWHYYFNKFKFDDIYHFVHHELYLVEKEFISGKMIDRFALNASLKNPINVYNTYNTYNNFENTVYTKIFDQYPWNCDFTDKIIGAWSGKVLIFKNVYRFHNGHHALVGRIGFTDKVSGVSYTKDNITSIYNNDSTIDSGQFYYDSSFFQQWKQTKYFINISHFKWNSNVMGYLRQRRDHYHTAEAINETNNVLKFFDIYENKINLNNIDAFKFDCWRGWR